MSLPRIARIDRRYLYIILFVLVSFPFLYPLKWEIVIGEHSTLVFEVTDELSEDSIVISSFDFGPSTIPENRPQSKAHLFHCIQRNLKVVALAFWASGAPVGEAILRSVYGSDFPDIPEYGTRIVYLGYVPGAEVGMQTFGDSPMSAKGTDHYGTNVADLPLMQEINSAADFDLWAEWTSGTPGEQQVIQFVQGRHPFPGDELMPLVVGSTAVSVPGMMPFYVSGQILGILNGMAGAAEYETLLIDNYEYDLVEGLAGMDSQSLGHLLIIVLVIVGNAGYAIGKSRGGTSA